MVKAWAYAVVCTKPILPEISHLHDVRLTLRTARQTAAQGDNYGNCGPHEIIALVPASSVSGAAKKGAKE